MQFQHIAGHCGGTLTRSASKLYLRKEIGGTAALLLHPQGCYEYIIQCRILLGHIFRLVYLLAIYRHRLAWASWQIRDSQWLMLLPEARWHPWGLSWFSFAESLPGFTSFFQVFQVFVATMRKPIHRILVILSECSHHILQLLQDCETLSTATITFFLTFSRRGVAYMRPELLLCLHAHADLPANCMLSLADCIWILRTSCRPVNLAAQHVITSHTGVHKCLSKVFTTIPPRPYEACSNSKLRIIWGKSCLRCLQPYCTSPWIICVRKEASAAWFPLF